MKLSFSAEDEKFREELLTFLDEYCPPEARHTRDMIGSDGVDEDGIMIIQDWAKQWQATLFDHGWMIPSFPKELGGRNATPTQTLIFLEEPDNFIGECSSVSKFIRYNSESDPAKRLPVSSFLKTKFNPSEKGNL